MNPTEHILDKFERVSAIPRGTGYEANIRQWLIAWGTARNFKSRVDVTGNLVIQVPASAGYESRETLILQGHLDMVWQQTPESNHDFEKDPIPVIHDGDWIHAKDTTLGADNGIAIALMLALVEGESVSHPPLELLFTVAEEQGVIGADNLDPSLLTGKTLINLDSEQEGVFTVGCIGGGSVNITLPVSWRRQAADEIAYEIKVDGLQGGHSGEDINKHRANADKLIGRVLEFIQRDVPLRLSTLQGGTARNAIPRNAEALFVCPKDQSAVCREKFSAIVQIVQAEHARTDAGLSITLTEKNGDPIPVNSYAETETALQLLVSLPQGVAAMSAENPGSIETSNNIGIVELKEDGLLIVSNHRSLYLSRLEEITACIEAHAWLAGAHTERTKIFSPWQPNMESALLAKCVETYKSVFAATPKIELSHGGLECGIISDRCGGLDTISMGPIIENPHSPDERLFVPSLEKVWDFLIAVLAI